MADLPPPLPPAPGAEAAALQPKKKKSKKSDRRDEPGAVVHALANHIMGNHAAAHMFGNVNYRKRYISGKVIRVFDSRRPGARNAQYSLKVRWDIPGQPGKEYDILRQHTTFGPIPAGKNPTSSFNYADSLNVRDSQAVRGSTTYVPDAMGAALNSSADASDQAQSTGRRGNLGSNSDNTSVIPEGTGASVNTTGQNNAEQRTSGENSNTLSNSSSTSNASSTAPPPVAATANATSASNAPSASAAAGTSQQQSRRRSSSGRRQEPHDLEKDPITVEHASGTKHTVVAMCPNPGGKKWVLADSDCVKGDVTKGPPDISWYQKGLLGEKVCPNNPQFNGSTGKMSRLQALQLMWPPQHLELVLQLTNERLKAAEKQEMSMQELVKWLGMCLLITRVDYFGSRRDLWDEPKSYSKYIPAPDFKKTGMSRHRFEEIWAAVRWSKQPETRPDDKNSSEWRWMLIDDFVTHFNQYRAATFMPGGSICIDESMIRWYGKGGAFLSEGLPHYVAMDRKPENGCEIQNAACVASSIMLQLKIVKSKEDEDRLESSRSDKEERAGLNHGTKVVLDLTKPWNTTERGIIGDSAFASVSTAVEVKKNGNNFTGCVKTATKEFPLKELDGQVFTERGSRAALAHIDERSKVTSYLAWSWLDRNRRFFISTQHGLEEGEEIFRERMRQVDDDPNAPPERVAIQARQPLAVEYYYAGAGIIDNHNRVRQADLMADRRLGTTQWDMRVGLGIAGIIFTDAFFFYQKTLGSDHQDTCPNEFFSGLADEMIDNTIGVRATRARNVSPAELDSAEEDNTNDEPTLRPTLRVKPGNAKNKDGKPKLAQGRCQKKGCNRESTRVCSKCTHPTDSRQKQYWFCLSCKGCTGWQEHLEWHRENDA